MKKILFATCVVALFLSACVSREVVEQTTSQRDSLSRVVAAKDSLIEAVFADINTITENLAQIKVRENIITQEPEGFVRPVDQINSDLAAIEALMEQNRQKIADLQRTSARLRRANLKIGELEKLIGELNGRIERQDGEIVALRKELDKRSEEVTELGRQIDRMEQEHRSTVDSLTTSNRSLDESLHAVYYVVGEEKKLREAGIVEKEGFIGRTLVPAKQNSLEFFVKSDSRKLIEVAIGQKKATLVTSHPEGSYELITDSEGVVLKLIITDPVRFWEASRVLIVSHK